MTTATVLFEGRKPAFATVANSGGIYSITFYKEANGSTSSREGYSKDVFKDLPPNLPLIDYRSGTFKRILRFILSTDGPKETSPFGTCSLAEYFESAKGTGATITTDGDFFRLAEEA